MFKVRSHQKWQNIKRREKSIYKYVYKITYFEGNIKYLSKINIYNINCYYDTLREAALRVDMEFITRGKSPVNILKKK